MRQGHPRFPGTAASPGADRGDRRGRHTSTISKATNGDAAARALASYDCVYWIAGGRPKEDGLAATLPWLDRVRSAFLIGEAEEAFARELDGKVEVVRCGTLAEAFPAARSAARADGEHHPVVLLSPACASFDQFPNFEARGDAFRALGPGDCTMSLSFSRTDTSLLSRWWWTVDRWTVVAVLLIAGLGIVLIMAASPPVAQRIGLEPFYFARRQMAYVPVAIVVMLITSLLSPKGVRRCAGVMLLIAFVATVATLFFGAEVKGARRWLSIAGASIQPSEFLKPAFAVVCAALIASSRGREGWVGYPLSAALLAAVAGILLLQPDVGTTLLIAGVWCLQIFLAGCPLALIGLLAVAFVGVGVGAYFVFDHVRYRVDLFLDPASRRGLIRSSARSRPSRAAACSAAVPAKGTVKAVLPDAHADFIFAVAGEEFGLFVCLLIVGAVRLRRPARLHPRLQGHRPVRAAGGAARCWRCSACRR